MRWPVVGTLMLCISLCGPVFAQSACGPALSAAAVANVQTLLTSLGQAQAGATTAAQQYIPYLNALLNATSAYNAAVAGGADSSTLETLANAQSSALAAVTTAQAAWSPAFAQWSNAYNALLSALSADGIDGTMFSCYGITPNPPPPVTYACSEVYTGDLLSVDNEGPLFMFLNEQGPLNHYVCTQSTTTPPSI
jgi:hypothetical protein